MNLNISYHHLRHIYRVSKCSVSSNTQTKVSYHPLRAMRFRWSHHASNVLDVMGELESRQLIAQVTSRALRQHLLEKPRTVYLGIDPTANSLHVGNLLALIGLVHFALKGHQTIVLLGGGTGAVGDPSGRSSERTILPREVVNSNLDALHQQINHILASALRHAQTRLQPTCDSTTRTKALIPLPSVKNNMEWLSDLTLLEFLNSVGKSARVSSMLARDSVKQRLESGSGISFTEFTYQLLQAYDFSELRTRYDCTVQLGGSDQYGNIMSGIENMSKINTSSVGSQHPTLISESGAVAYGVTLPLLTNAKGEKLGKSAGNALWLSPALTAPVDLYQAFLRTPDSEVRRYLHMLTFVPLEEIERTVYEHEQSDRQEREPQKLLAREIVLLVHGSKGLSQALAATELLFPKKGNIISATQDEWQFAFQGSPHHLRLPAGEVIGCSIDSLVVSSGLCKSKGEARGLRQSGALMINHRLMSEVFPVTEADMLAERYILLMRGRTAYKLVSILPHEQNHTS